MAVVSRLPELSVRDLVSPEEWERRVDLAACYRLVAMHGWTDLVFTHISARAPDAPDQFLLNPFGLSFEEVTASSLVKLSMEGEVVMDTPYDINLAGFTIHSAVLGARPDIGCVVHTHTVHGMAVSAQADGLLPLTQTALRFYNRIGYHDYEGIALDTGECERLARDLAGHPAMILRNHGLLACGATVAEAFNVTHGLERACEAQIAAQASGARLVMPPPEVCENTARIFEAALENPPEGDRTWPALRRMVDRAMPGYDQ